MIRAIFAFLLLLLVVARGDAATFPTCATIGGVNPCVTTADLLGDVMVNIRFFGAKGDNSTDDTAAIQAAIDYAYNNSIQGIYCPSGTYKISGAGNAMLYLDPPGNLRTNWSAPTIFNFSLAFVGGSGGLGNHQNFGCVIRPTTANTVALVIGPGQEMAVKGISIIGPGEQANCVNHRGALPAAGVGLGIAGGNAGASFTLIENTDVENFYTLYSTNVNNGSLGDSNSFHKVDGTNGFYGIHFVSSQNDINDVAAARMAGTAYAIDSDVSRQVVVSGGNFSADAAKSAAFTISSPSPFTKVADPGGAGSDYTFTTTVTAPDGCIASVYDSFDIVTAHFGVIPLTLNAWNAATSVATFMIYPPWAFDQWGNQDMTVNTDIQAEVAAVTKVYASERVRTFKGSGIFATGFHVENSLACTTLFEVGVGFNGDNWNEIKNAFFNSNPSFPAYAPVNSPTDAQLALFYCGQTFPFIVQDAPKGFGIHLKITDSYLGQSTSDPPLIFEQGEERFLKAERLSGIAPLNMRIGDDNSGGYNPQTNSGFGQIESVEGGAGEWDRFYMMPHGVVDTFHVGNVPWNGAEGQYGPVLVSPYYGFRPAPYAEPNLSPALFSLVNGSLGALGSYPAIDCQTIYKSIEWNSAFGATKHVRSAHCPGYSWGQDLNNTTTAETVQWTYKGQSAMLYLTNSPKTMSWLFPGLGFQLSGGNNPSNDSYVVMGVYPALGYITAVDVANGFGRPLQGALTTTFSCTSGCALKQAAYSWTSSSP